VDLEERYGKLFGEMVRELWDRGGKEIWETVEGSSKGMEQESSEAQQHERDKQEDMVQEEEDDGDEDAEGEGEGEGEGETETREGSAMEE